jgi:hypothetical protein
MKLQILARVPEKDVKFLIGAIYLSMLRSLLPPDLSRYVVVSFLRKLPESLIPVRSDF